MKKILLGSTALLGAAVAAAPAQAADGIKLSLGGFFRTAVLYNIDDHGKNDLGNRRYNDGVFSDGEIYFLGKTTLDNGLTVGVRVELEAEQSGDQIDAAYAYFQGGFGEARIGSQLGALATMCVTPVGGTTNFGAFSQNQIINNAYDGFSAGVCNSVDDVRGADKSQKIVYISPNFGGFQLGASWAPNGNHESSGVTGGHTGMPAVQDGEQRNIIDVYGTYAHDFTGWSVNWGGGGSWTLSNGGVSPSHNKGAAYQTGLNITVGNLSFGGSGEYYKNGMAPNQDAWIAGAGAAYNIDAWTVGLQYSYGDVEFAGHNVDRKINTVAVTGKYDLGPGISLDATAQYAWVNADKADTGADGYKSFGLGLGTAFTF
ncbi:MAG TPA: porin [Dongiaceae bacterium]